MALEKTCLLQLLITLNNDVLGNPTSTPDCGHHTYKAHLSGTNLSWVASILAQTFLAWQDFWWLTHLHTYNYIRVVGELPGNLRPSVLHVWYSCRCFTDGPRFHQDSKKPSFRCVTVEQMFQTGGELNHPTVLHVWCICHSQACWNALSSQEV